jgi:deoxyribodipyrimidine photo-lyase
MSYSVVWFKRDLRVIDHAALHAAARRGPILCLYVIEPSVWAQPDAALQHYQFLLESLRDLDADLRRLGGKLHVIAGEFVDLVARLLIANPFDAVYAHEETGNDITYKRDLAVGQWCKVNKVEFHEFRQFGVVRKLKNRDDWKSHWDKHVRSPLLPVPAIGNLQFVPLPWATTLLPSPAKLGLALDVPKQRQLGGRRLGLEVLQDFLSDRSAQYRGGISSPLSAPTACSRLSPYLTFGCVSLREVVQSTYDAIAELPVGNWQKKGLVAFVSRLYWHCHFIQKLESEPEMEYQNLHRGYDGLREYDWNPAHFEALTTARTGWPLVDACVVMLRETGGRCWCPSPLTHCGCTGDPWGSGWRGSFWTTSRASTGARCKCNLAQLASTPRGCTTPSSKRKTTTRTAISCDAGCRICAACQMPGFLSRGACRLRCKSIWA